MLTHEKNVWRPIRTHTGLSSSQSHVITLSLKNTQLNELNLTFADGSSAMFETIRRVGIPVRIRFSRWLNHFSFLFFGLFSVASI